MAHSCMAVYCLHNFFSVPADPSTQADRPTKVGRSIQEAEREPVRQLPLR